MAKNKLNAETAENRRKSDVRFWFRFLSLVIIVPTYLAIIICLLAMPRSTVSNIEKRQLAEFPEFSWESYWKGEYTADIATYFNDTVPYRDSLKQAASQLLNLLGIKYNDVQVSGPMAVVNDQNNSSDPKDGSSDSSASSVSSGAVNRDTDTDSTDSDTSQNFGQEIADGVYTNGQIVVKQNGHYRAMSMFGGGSGDVYAQSVNNIASDLPGVKVYSMIAPTASEYYTPANFKEYNASQSGCIEKINAQLSGVTAVDVCTVLNKHNGEEIYTRTDHHWQALGAYYAAKEFADKAGVQFSDLSKYEKVDVEGYVGTMYAFTDNNADLLNDPETFTYYKPNNSYTTDYYDQSFNYAYSGELLVNIGDISSMYMTFMGGDGYITKITTDVKNGRKLCVVKDSYGNAEIPFYVGSFEEIYVVDMRYLEVNLVDFVNQMGVTDLLFTMCTYSAVGTNADNLEVLRTQNKGQTIIDNGAVSSNIPEDTSSSDIDASNPDGTVSDIYGDGQGYGDGYTSDDSYAGDDGTYEGYNNDDYWE